MVATLVRRPWLEDAYLTLTHRIRTQIVCTTLTGSPVARSAAFDAATR